MKLTPEEIRDYTFGKSFRGYDKDAVDQYLSSLSQDWQKGIDDHADLAKRLEQTERELNRLKDVESIMLRTIKEGDDNARKLYETAEAKSAELIAESTKSGDEYFATKKAEGDDYWAKAEAKAEAIIESAEVEKIKLLSEANTTIANLKQEIKADIETSEKEYKSLDIAKQQLLYDLKSLLGNTTDRLSNIDTKYAPEVFDAKKVSLSNISKATIEPRPKPLKQTKVATKAKVDKVKTDKKVTAKAKVTTNKKEKVAKITKPKVAKSVVKKVKQQVEADPEDDGLPTVQKILALEENIVAVKQEPHLPTIEAETEIELEGNQNGSFFDAI
jgi:cell division initiation protein